MHFSACVQQIHFDHYLVEPKPPPKPPVAVRASFEKVSRFPRIILGLLCNAQQLAIVDPNTPLYAVLHFGA